MNTYTIDDARRDNPVWFEADSYYGTVYLRQWPLAESVWLLTRETPPAGIAAAPVTFNVRRIDRLHGNSFGPASNIGMGDMETARATIELLSDLEQDGRFRRADPDTKDGCAFGFCDKPPRFELGVSDGWVAACDRHVPVVMTVIFNTTEEEAT